MTFTDYHDESRTAHTVSWPTRTDATGTPTEMRCACGAVWTRPEGDDTTDTMEDWYRSHVRGYWEDHVAVTRRSQADTVVPRWLETATVDGVRSFPTAKGRPGQ